MELQINGEPKSLDADTLTVGELLDHLDVEQRRGVAVAVNNAVVSKSQWAEHTVEDGDVVEIIRATQGG
ncbi:MAG: sulfur carrier protein ThiS [Persicimonas sp.]